jgi:hypothetical protein
MRRCIGLLEGWPSIRCDPRCLRCGGAVEARDVRRGRESYATTDTTNRCLSLYGGLSAWHGIGGSLHRETYYRVAGGLRLVESVVPLLVARRLPSEPFQHRACSKIGEPLHSVPRHEGGRLRGILSEFRGVPRADTGENDVGPHGESTERPPEPWPGGKRRFTFLPTSISRSQATDHGRDA